MTVLTEPRRLLVAVLVLFLAGATAFGLVHVVGGFVNDNMRAVGFGLVLAMVAGALLRVAVHQARRGQARRGQARRVRIG